ncbi:MAG: hypothetical protein RLZZ387_1262 [Chloroflexota bacterium]|jgi:serine/threonine protein kinase
MNDDLSDLLRRLDHAASPAEVFGPLAGDQEATLRRRYRALARAAHPDRHPAAADAAHRAFTALASWHERARQQIARGVYGAAPRITATHRGRRYEGFAEPLPGDVCELYPAHADGEAVLLKVARRPRDGDLLTAEARALRQIARDLAGQPLRAHLPTLADSFALADASGERRLVNVLLAEPATLSLSAVLRAFPAGIDPADAAWVFNRILAALGAAHSLGLVHGALNPDHVLIRPADHNAILLDWCYSVPIGEPLRAFCPPYAADYPPEVLARRPATPATDLFLAARCVTRLLSGQGDAARLPPRVPAAIRALLSACLIPAPHRRPADAWQVFDDFRDILRERYGPPAFRPFPMQADTGAPGSARPV